ncbi:MAG: phosphatase PAP2 family protein [Gordonia sp. (in: high G+C Gram-positive bacteria)]|uniref:phosphatase PAP2 family protein n=1 Tax=Gordonia sp. (in: high G+C Gram-positive bacteria) TaxID=84139 RepID=UPI0039E560B1
MRPFGWDQAITEWVVSIRAEPWTSLWQMVTVLGDTLTLTLVVIGVFVLAWLGERIDLSVLIASSGISGYVLMIVLKHVFGRQRPPEPDRLIDVDTLSFPSGHAMLSVIVLGLTAFIAYQLYPWVRSHRAILAVAPVLMLLIGLSRVYLGVHWMSDVVFGWFFGLIWAAVCLFGHQRAVARFGHRPDTVPAKEKV